MADDSELVGGKERRSITIVDYSTDWPAMFERERRRILVALGAVALRVEHVGSTSVPGLAAKPIVDIQVSVSDLEDEPRYAGPLAEAGFALRVRAPGQHRMFRTTDLAVHVHVCSAGSEWERRHLLLRDWLRHDAADRQAYEALKRYLATRDWSDLNAYAAATGDLIAEMTSRAETWARASGWTLPAGRSANR